SPRPTCARSPPTGPSLPRSAPKRGSCSRTGRGQRQNDDPLHEMRQVPRGERHSAAEYGGGWRERLLLWGGGGLGGLVGSGRLLLLSLVDLLGRHVDGVVTAHRPLEVADPAAQRVAELRDLARPEDEQHHEEDEEELAEPEIAHVRCSFQVREVNASTGRASPQQFSRAGRPLVWAHRGASCAAPENTLAAFRLAAELGADGVELDAQRCATGEVVVLHDESLGRTTGHAALLPETPWSTVRTLDAGARFSEKRSEERRVGEEWRGGWERD